MTKNDPATICKLLRAIARGDDAKQSGHDVIFLAAIALIEAAAVKDAE